MNILLDFAAAHKLSQNVMKILEDCFPYLLFTIKIDVKLKIENKCNMQKDNLTRGFEINKKTTHFEYNKCKKIHIYFHMNSIIYITNHSESMIIPKLFEYPKVMCLQIEKYDNITDHKK